MQKHKRNIGSFSRGNLKKACSHGECLVVIIHKTQYDSDVGARPVPAEEKILLK